MLQTLKDEVHELRQTVTHPQTLQALMDEVDELRQKVTDMQTLQALQDEVVELRQKVTDMQTQIDELVDAQRWRGEWNAWGER